jgi:hypothetical protein
VEVPPGYVLGSKIISSWGYRPLVEDPSGQLYCYLGYVAADQQPSGLAFYGPAVAVRDKDGMSSDRFVQLRGGTLFKSAFLDAESPYRVLDDRLLVLPSGTDSYYGVVERGSRSEDVARTRELFGGTYDEVTKVAAALAVIVGRTHHELARLPRVTFSKTRNNRCDLTDCLIPEDFPYVAFGYSPYVWSHVSLYGLYKLLDLLCPTDRPWPSPLKKLLSEAAISDEVVNTMLKAADPNRHPLPFPDYW